MSFIVDISPEIPRNRKLEYLSDGAYGDVYLIIDIDDNENPPKQKFVVKKIKVSDAKKDRDQKICELVILRNLNHPRIVPFKGYSQSPHYLELFMAYMKLGSLTKYIKANGPFDEVRTKLFTSQILEGLSYLHNCRPNPIIHRDIKGENILMEDESNVRIADFGVSKILTEMTNARTNTGTFNYKAPETFTPGRIYDVKADIWSVGCTVCEMLAGRPPYETVRNTLDLINKLSLGERPDQGLRETNSPSLQQFLDKCFKQQPEDRPSADELLQDSFFKTVN
ncbi:Mitogen-activated protein kinase kinase kinase 2 [Bulinus truncatus]|nr:Mitogen-activated protein kinase kinase kinase 2 [Bulinus truncatus]